MGFFRKFRELRRRWSAWWCPFWYGDPCLHGIYGISYSDDWSGRINCKICWHELTEKCKREEREHRVAELAEALRRTLPAALKEVGHG